MLRRVLANLLAKLRGSAGSSSLPGPDSAVEPAPSLGERGEEFAATWLKERGYVILERNFQAGRDEADIVATDPDGHTIVIIEVKTRKDDHIMPEEHVNRTKQHNLSRAAARLKQRPGWYERPMRFDVIAIVWPEGCQPIVRHHQAAFSSTL
ncbi:MAG: YraN family protein [Phycisphaerales bacterium]